MLNAHYKVMKVPVWAICLEDFSCSCSESLFWMMSSVGELRYVGFMRGLANLGCELLQYCRGYVAETK